MPAFDWPLTLFTLTAQLVLGAFAVLWVTDLVARQLAEPREQEYLTRVAVWVLGPLMALGFLASLLHLGQPLYAARAVRNVASSWLSREVVFLGAFFGMGALYAFLWWRQQERFTLRASYGAVVGVVGGVGLLSMVMLYLLPAMPTWNRITNPMAFVASALLLGPLLVGVVFVTTYRHHRSAASLEPLIGLHLRSMVVTVAVGALLTLAALAITLVTLPGIGLEGQAARTLLVDEHRLLLLGRVGLLLLGLALGGLLLARVWRDRDVAAARPLLWGMLVLVVGSELLGRLLFYATAVPLRPAGPFT